jgi:CHAT domain-containing protein
MNRFLLLLALTLTACTANLLRAKSVKPAETVGLSEVSTVGSLEADLGPALGGDEQALARLFNAVELSRASDFIVRCDPELSPARNEKGLLLAKATTKAPEGRRGFGGIARASAAADASQVLAAARETFEVRYAADDHLFLGFKPFEFLTLTRAQAMLKQGELLVYFVEHESKHFALCVKHDEAKCVELASLADTRAAVLALETAVRTVGSDWKGPADSAGQALLAPWSELLEGVEALTIVPSPVVRNCPFAAVRLGGHVLIDRLRIGYAPCAFFLSGQRAKFQAPRVLAVGDPPAEPRFAQHLPALPGARREAGVVAYCFSGGTLLLGEAATKEALKSAVAEHTVLHFATHGMRVANDPGQSFLLMAGGTLSAREIAQLPLHHVLLVVLSACESGVGGADSADSTGADSLAGAFLAGGANAVVGTLWSVDDTATILLMVGVYREIAGLRGPRALQQAQLALRKRPKFSHPFFWAPFVCYGRS